MLLPPEVPIGLWPSIFAVQGPGASTASHQHHGLHLLLVRSGELTAAVGDAVTTAAGLLTPPDLAHAVDATGATVVMLFIDPESEPGGRLTTGLAGAPRFFDSPAHDALLADLPAVPNGADLAAKEMYGLAPSLLRRPV